MTISNLTKYFSAFISFFLSISLLTAENVRAQEAENQPNNSTQHIVMFGDSITAGYGLSEEEALPTQVQHILRRKGYNVEVINAGISGDTTEGGLNRLSWTLKTYTPDIVVLELGANDMLRGYPPSNAKANLDAMLRMLAQQHITVMFTAVKAMPDLGEEYRKEFDAIYPDLANKHSLKLEPFMLTATFGKPGLMQDDGVHPTAKGANIIAQHVAEALIPRLHQAAKAK